MAEYSEVIKQFKRMCNSMTGFGCVHGECPMGYAFGCENIGQCRKIAFERPDVFEKKVMAWASDNPEPVYPTWSEWLVEIGVFPKMMSTIPSKALDAISNGVCKPIPADIAEKLGIKPKAGGDA